MKSELYCQYSIVDVFGRPWVRGKSGWDGGVIASFNHIDSTTRRYKDRNGYVVETGSSPVWAVKGVRYLTKFRLEIIYG